MLWASAEVTIFSGYIKIKWRVWVGEEAIASSEKKGLDLEFFYFFIKKPEWFSTRSWVSVRLHSQLERAMLRTIVPINIVPVNGTTTGYIMFSSSTLGGDTTLFRGFLRPLLPVDILRHMIKKSGGRRQTIIFLTRWWIIALFIVRNFRFTSCAEKIHAIPTS